MRKITFLDYAQVNALVESNKKGDIDASYSIWAILAIDSWVRQFSKGRNELMKQIIQDLKTGKTILRRSASAISKKQGAVLIRTATEPSFAGYGKNACRIWQI